jgi:glycosyltransferase involved in cell wall biosynthesis
MLPYLSLVLAVRNERKMLPGLIDQLLEQNYPPEFYEILVVDGESTDGTADLIRRRYGDRRVRVRVLDNPQRSVSTGRNRGVRAASGEAIVFLSGHCRIPSKNLLADTAEILETTGAGCLCRPQPLAVPAETRMGEAIAHARSSRIGRGPVGPEMAGFVDPPGFAGTYRRSVFDQAGFFDEGFDACAGLDFNERVRQAGIRAYYDPRLAVDEQPPQKLRSLLAEMFHRGRGASRFMRKHPECASPWEIAPVGILLALLLTLFAWNQLPLRMAAIVTLPLAMFSVAVLLASMRIGARFGFRNAWRAPAVLSTIYLGEGLGLLYEYAFPGGNDKRRKTAPVLTVPQFANDAADRAA